MLNVHFPCLQYVEQKIDLFNGESLEPWYLKINPSASAPSLVVGNEKITQSVEIIRWADRQGAPLGGDSVDRAFVDQWLNKVDSWDGNLFAAANTPAGAALKACHHLKSHISNPPITQMARKFLLNTGAAGEHGVQDQSGGSECEEESGHGEGVR